MQLLAQQASSSGMVHQCLGEDPRFEIPWVWLGSTERVLAVGHAGSVGIWNTVIGVQPQEGWNEFYEFPVELKGSTVRKYKKEFLDNWLHYLQATASEDRTAGVELRWSLRYLTGGRFSLFRTPFHRPLIRVAMYTRTLPLGIRGAEGDLRLLPKYFSHDDGLDDHSWDTITLFLPSDTTLQTNVAAKRETTEHTIVWHFLDSFGKESVEAKEAGKPGRGPATVDGKFVRKFGNDNGLGLAAWATLLLQDMYDQRIKKNALPAHISSPPSWQCTATSFASPKLGRGLQGAEGGRKSVRHEAREISWALKAGDDAVNMKRRRLEVCRRRKGLSCSGNAIGDADGVQ
ncbi:hypothetical protein M405DRAFT_847408 [Rhizopogon salebrosus TDB-379]|nr:hypothetical protein M405DRAFT_847408 [Rhizopogon salebrosus TDB-379]